MHGAPSNLDDDAMPKDRMALVADKTDPTMLFVAGNGDQIAYRVDWKAGRWTAMTEDDTADHSAPHCDCRNFFWSPKGSELLLVSDGGIFARAGASKAGGRWRSANGDIGMSGGLPHQLYTLFAFMLLPMIAQSHGLACHKLLVVCLLTVPTRSMLACLPDVCACACVHGVPPVHGVQGRWSFLRRSGTGTSIGGSAVPKTMTSRPRPQTQRPVNLNALHCSPFFFQNGAKIWILDVFCYRIPTPMGAGGPNQNTSQIQHQG